MVSFFAAVGLVAACSHARAPSPDAAEAAGRGHYPGKLPLGVTPHLYDVHLTLDPNEDTFAGQVVIAVELREPHTRIFLHAEHLTFSETWVEGADGGRQRAHVEADATPGLIALRVPEPLPAGMTSLHFAYRAPFSPGLAGLYRSEAGGARYVFSQLEPIAARRVLPCFDEPRFKTPFEIRVSAPKELMVLSNGAVMGEQIALQPGSKASFKTTSFSPTPPLPTYLLALAAGPFDVRDEELPQSPLRHYPLPMRALAVAGEGNNLSVALQSAGQLLAALEAWADLPYPFAKLDLLAVPDFAYGAMENAGLVTFRDWLMLLHSTRASHAQRRASFSVMAHELTHQWFGNWVTMAWWDDLWLNESFAVWRGQRTAHHLRPQLGLDVDLVEGMGYAMHHDRLKSARQVREPCRNRDDITSAADVITYAKGAGLLTMMEHWLGTERMNKGLRAYLAAHPYGTAASGTFLNTVAAAAEEPRLPAVMQSFLDQPGAPELDVSMSCSNGGAQLSVAQDRYRPLGSDVSGGPWHIPVCIRYGDAAGHSQHACHLLSEPSATWTLRGGCPRWLVLNAEGAGYYRVRADADVLGRQLAAWRAQRLTPAEAVAFVDNAEAELSAGVLSTDVALGIFAEGTANEHPAVARRSLGALVGHFRRHVPAQSVEAARAGLLQIVSPAAERLSASVALRRKERAQRSRHGAEGEAAADRLGQTLEALRDVRWVLAEDAGAPAVRTALSHAGIAWLGRLESERHKPGTEMPLSYAPDTAELGADEVTLALHVAAETLGAPFYDRLVEALALVDGGEDRRRLIAAIGQTRSAALAEKTRALAISGQLHVNEVMALIEPQLADPIRSDAAWAFLLSQRDTLMSLIGDEHWHRLIGAGAYRCDANSTAQLQQTFAPVLSRIPGGPRALSQAGEAIALCTAKQQAIGDAVAAWFTAAATPPTTSAPSTTR